MSSTEASVFEPNHETFVTYPCTSLQRGLSNQEELQEELFVLPVADASSRHDSSLPLIDDPDVIQTNAISMDLPWNMRTCSVHKATTNQSNLEKERSPNHAQDVDCLIDDMRIAQQYNGTTCLYALTYRSTGDQHDMVRLQRQTTFAFPGSKMQEKGSYEMPVSDLTLTDEPAAAHKVWLEILLDLIYRRSDAAVLAVRQAMRFQNMMQDKPLWKSDRETDYQACFNFLPMGTSLLRKDDSTDCRICWNDWVKGDELCRLQCSGNHIFHKRCMMRVLWAEGIDGRCWFYTLRFKGYLLTNIEGPMCRSPLGVSGHPQQLIYGISVRDEKHYDDTDDRYSPFEHWERSCADLDQCRASEVEDMLRVNGRLLEFAFEHIVEGALKEEASSTPLHRQIVRRKEFSLVRRSITSTAEVIGWMTVKENELYGAIMSRLRSQIVTAFKDGGLVPTLNAEQLQIWTSNPEKISEEALRPFFMATPSRWSVEYSSACG